MRYGAEPEVASETVGMVTPKLKETGVGVARDAACETVAISSVAIPIGQTEDELRMM